MFQYLGLATVLAQVATEKKQLKTILYQNEKKLKGFRVSAAYSLLSLIMNNYAEFEAAGEDFIKHTKAKITNKYLLYILMGEFINK